MAQHLKVHNGKVVTPTKILDGGSVLVTGTTITAVSEINIEVEDAVEIDAKGNYVCPGFIDIHDATHSPVPYSIQM